jgi:hypothetical protein
VAGRDFDGAGSKVRIHKIVGDDGQRLLAEGMPNTLANQVTVPLVSDQQECEF